MIEGYYINTNRNEVTFTPCSLFYSTIFLTRKETNRIMGKDLSFIQYCKCSINVEMSDIFDLTRSLHRTIIKSKLPVNVLIDDEYYTREEIEEFLEEEVYPPWDLLNHDFMLNTIKAAGYKGYVIKSVDGYTYMIFDKNEYITVEEKYNLTKNQE